MGMIMLELLTILAALLLYCYIKMQQIYTHWSARGTTQMKPYPIVGNMLPILTYQKGFSGLYQEVYNDFKNEKQVGIYEIFQPVLVVRDAALMKRMMVKDFQCFTDRVIFLPPDSVSSSALFNLEGKYWRSVRHSVSPTYSTNRLKLIFQHMIVSSEYLIEKIKNDKINIDLRAHLSNYALHSMASSIFGISVSDEKTVNDFTEASRKFFSSGLWQHIQQTIILVYPKIINYFKLNFFDSNAEKYFENLLTSTFRQRESMSVQQNDYVGYLLKLKEKGSINVIEKDKDDSYLNLDEANVEGLEKIEFTDKLLFGQSVQFLLGGFDPIVTNTLFAMFDFAQNPEYQDRARIEVKDVIAKHGSCTYAALKEMTFLDQCLNETIRLHSFVEFITRTCTQTYITPDGMKIEKDTKIVFPVKAMNFDPQHYPNPDDYDPDRFGPDMTIPISFIPFGAGPRICVGMRYALASVKLALASMLDNFSFTLSPKTKLPVLINSFGIVSSLKSDIYFNIATLK